MRREPSPNSSLPAPAPPGAPSFLPGGEGLRLGPSAPALPHLALFAGSYLLGAGIAQWLAIIPGTGISIWPPAGLFLGTLILTDPRSWPWWILSGLLAELAANLLWFGNPLPLAILLNLGNALHAVLGAWLVRRSCPGPFRLDSLRGVLALVGLGAMTAAAASATVGAAALAWTEGQPFARAWGLWWAGDATGVLILAPLVLVVVPAWREPAPLPPPRRLEAVLVGLALLAAAALALGDLLPFAYIVMPPLLWVAIRFELRGAVAAMAALTVMSVAFTATGISPFAGDLESQPYKYLMLQLFLAISALTVLVVAVIARQNAQALLRLRAARDELEDRVAERTASLSESEQRLRLAHEAAGLGAWEIDLVSRTPVWSDQARALLGMAPDAPATLDALLARIHPEDRAGIEADLARMARPGTDPDHRSEFRVVLPDGRVRWLERRGRVEAGADGAPRRALGVLRDVTERRIAGQQADLLMREVNHRSRNMLSLVQALARQIAADDIKDFRARFEDRLRALAANQDLLVSSGWRDVAIDRLIATVLSHFQDLVGGRIVLDGPPFSLNTAAAQTLGLVLHELATNAGKYGALSGDKGEVRIAWRLSGEGEGRRFAIAWTERGGPPVAPPGRRGFGSTVIERMSRLALDGEVTVDLAPEGLSWRLECPADRVAERGGPEGAGALPPGGVAWADPQRSVL